MANKDFQLKLRQIQSQIPKAIKRLAGVAKVEGLQFIASNFEKQGFESKPGQVKKWKRKKGSNNKPILVGEKRGGSLKKSWKGTAAPEHAEFTSQLPYAEVHNEGLKAGRPPGFKMPQRQMIGQSEALNKRIENKFDRMANDIFN